MSGGVTNKYTGTLLTGQVTAFGYFATGGGTAAFDLRATPTGGPLLSNSFVRRLRAVNLSSANSTFTGSFAANFNGAAKGQAGLEDLIPPTITCPTNIVVESQAFAGGIPGLRHLSNAHNMTPDTNPAVMFIPPSGSFFALSPTGPETNYTVLIIAEDVSGNTNTCSFVVTVEDTLPPEFADTNNPTTKAVSPMASISTNDVGMCSAAYSFPPPFALDNSNYKREIPAMVTAIDQNGMVIPLTQISNGYWQGQFPVTTAAVPMW